MVLGALTLMATGLVAGLFGFKLFKLLLPLIGLVGGSVVGFVGFQTLFGSGAVSTTIAIFVAVTVGLVFALLSFVYFRIAVVAYMAILGASVLSYLGATLGLAENTFVITLLSISGIVLGIVIASHEMFSERLILAMTSFIGVTLILEGVFLITSNTSLEQLHQQGAITSVVTTIDQSFLWLFVWLTGGIVMMHLQQALLIRSMLDNKFQFEPLEAFGKK